MHGAKCAKIPRDPHGQDGVSASKQQSGRALNNTNRTSGGNVINAEKIFAERREAARNSQTGAAKTTTRPKDEAGNDNNGIHVQIKTFSTKRPTVERGFEQSKSLQAQVAKKRQERAASDTYYDDVALESEVFLGDEDGYLDEESLREEAFEEKRKRGLRGRFKRRGGMLKKTKRALKAAAALLSSPLLYFISISLYVFIFILGIIALFLIFVGDASVLGVSPDDILKGATSVLSAIGILESSVSVREIGAGVWALSVGIAIAGYLIISIFSLLVLRINVFGRSLWQPTLITLLGSILPIVQLFPWMVIWIGAVQFMTIFKAARGATGRLSPR